MPSPMRESGMLAGRQVLESIVADVEADRVPDESMLLDPDERAARYDRATATDARSTELNLRVAVVLGILVLALILVRLDLVDHITDGWLAIGAGMSWVGVVIWMLSNPPPRGRSELSATIEGRYGFAVTGFASWVVCDLPIAEVTFAFPIDPVMFENALVALEPLARCSLRHSCAIRFELPAIRSRSGMSVGNARLLRHVIERLIVPLDIEVGVEGIVLGGKLRSA
jgi:hypothetical protein